MKMNNLIKAFAAIAVSASVAACNDAEYTPLGAEGGETMVYLNEAASSRGGIVVMGEEQVSHSITVRLSSAADHDITVKLAVDPTLLDDYNNRMGTSYEALPEEYYHFDKEAVIRAGSISASPVNVTIEPFKAEGGVSYALPIAIVECDGARIADRPGNFVIELVVEIGQQPAAEFVTYHCATQLDPQTDWNLELYEYTLEWWVCQPGLFSKSGDTVTQNTGYNKNNQAIFNSGSNDEGGPNLYIRFGDMNHQSYPINNRFAYLQIKTMGTDQDFESPDPKENPLESGRWYHFAVVYKANDGTSTLYMNGEQVSQATSATGVPMEIDKMQICHIGSGEEQYRPNNTQMCQVRLWKTARTQQEIKQYMYVEPRYNDSNLVFYLPMNEGNNDEGIFHDVTGNGHNGPFGNMRTTYEKNPMRWTSVNLSSSNN